MKASGRFLLRLPPVLHGMLQDAAGGEGLSLNEYCVRRLATPASPLGTDPDARLLLMHAHEMFDGHLVGILLYGSWMRGKASDHSDVDALIVVESDVELTRTLYRQWDAQPLSWAGRTVDAHFAHLPGDVPVTGGVWAEAAVDGQVLFERGGRLSAQLRRVRNDIADGRLVRHAVHGQTYWTVSSVVGA